MILHCLNLSIMSVMVKLCSEEGLPVFEIFFISTLIASFCMILWAIYTKGKHLKINQPSLYASRAILGIVTMVTWYYALTLIPLTEATAINFTSPIFSATIAIAFLHEPLDWRRIGCLFLSFLGVVVVIRPEIEIVKFGTLLAILSSAIWAGLDIIIKIQTRTEKLTTQAFYITSLTAILSLPFVISTWQNPTIRQWISLTILGIASLFNYFAIFKAFRLVELTVLLPFDFTRLIFTLLLANVIFGEVMNIWTGIGAVIIFSSSIYLVHSETSKIRELSDRLIVNKRL